MPVTGGSALARRIRALGPAVRLRVAEAVEESGRAVLTDMKSFVPKDTHALATHLTVASFRKGLRVRVGLPTDGLASDHFYARFLEEGTKGGSKAIRNRKTGKVRVVTFRARAARPFMKPALDVNRRDIRARIGRAIRQALRQGAGR